MGVCLFISFSWKIVFPVEGERNIVGIETWVGCASDQTLLSLSGWPSAEEAAGPLSRTWAIRHGGDVWGRAIFCSFWARHQHWYGYGSTGLVLLLPPSLPISCPALTPDLFLLWVVLLHGIPLCLQLTHCSQQPAPGHWTCHIFWSHNFSVCFSLWKCCLQTLISSHALVNLWRAIARWVYFYNWSASAHFSPQVECSLLLCTDRPDCVDGRLSFIFYSHLKNMKEIYVTSPVDRKGQAVKGQVSNQLYWLLVSSFIIIFRTLVIIISECWELLFSYPLSLALHFTD